MNRSVRKKNTFISSDTTVEFALVLFPRILWWAKLVTVWATVACGLDMLGFHVLPKTCLILGRPKTVFALPKITRLDHFVRYCCFNIYERKVNLASFVKFALVVYPRLFRWAEFCTKRTMPECFVEVINKCLYLFRGAECRDNEADGKKWRGLAVPVLHVDNQVQNASLGTHWGKTCHKPRL